MNNFHNNNTLTPTSVTLLTPSIRKAKPFYTKGLGMQEINATENTLQLSADGKTPLITLIESADAKLKGRNVGLYHFAILFSSRQHLANILLNLINEQFSFTGFADHGVSEALYLKDFDGNEVELYADKDVKSWPTKDDGSINMFTDPLNVEELLTHATTDKYEIDKNAIMGHLHFFVNSLTEAHNYFVKTIGYNVVLYYGESALFVSDKQYHHHLGLNTWLGENSPKREENQVGLVSYNLNTPSAMWETINKNLQNANYDVNKISKNTYSTTDINGVKIIFDIV